MPFAVSGTDGMDGEASVVTSTDALRAPRVENVKVTSIWQEVLLPSDGGQLFSCEKSPAFAPEIATFVIESEPVPVLVSVRGSVTIEPGMRSPKSRGDGVSVPVIANVPVPEREALGTGAAGSPPLYTTESVAVLEPVVAGSKATCTSQGASG